MFNRKARNFRSWSPFYLSLFEHKGITLKSKGLSRLIIIFPVKAAVDLMGISWYQPHFQTHRLTDFRHLTCPSHKGSRMIQASLLCTSGKGMNPRCFKWDSSTPAKVCLASLIAPIAVKLMIFRGFWTVTLKDVTGVQKSCCNPKLQVAETSLNSCSLL